MGVDCFVLHVSRFPLFQAFFYGRSTCHWLLVIMAHGLQQISVWRFLFLGCSAAAAVSFVHGEPPWLCGVFFLFGERLSLFGHCEALTGYVSSRTS